MNRLGVLFTALAVVQPSRALCLSSRRSSQPPSLLLRHSTTSAQGYELSPPCIAGLSEIADQYDAFLVDQWGVLFDAHAPYPGAKAALEALRDAGKKVVLLSNSSKRRRDALRNLEVKMGLGPPGPDGLYLDIITSGEVTHALVSAGQTGHPSIVPGSKVYVCGSGDGDAAYVTELGCTLAGPRDADWVLARGNFVLVSAAAVTDISSDAPGGAVAATTTTVAVPAGVQADNFAAQTAFYASAASGLGACRARGLPLLVANPDTLRPGTNSPMPGTIGALYANGRLGTDDGLGQGADSTGPRPLGTVLYVGKPHGAVYAEAFRALAASPRPRFDVAQALRRGRVCAVGDALATDVAGGGVHLGSSGGGRVLVAHGVHAKGLGVPEGEGVPPAPEAVAAFLAAELGPGAGGRARDADVPTHVVPAFVW